MSNPSKKHSRFVACPSNKFQLKEYQIAVAKWLLDNPDQKGLYVVLPTGTGKTLVAANVAELLKRERIIDNVLVVTPKSLVKNFENTIRKCLEKHQIPSYYKIFSYDGLVNKKPAVGPKTLLIIDEAHNLRNVGTRRVAAVAEAAKNADRVLMLSADPMVNHPSDISMPMRLITPHHMHKEFPKDKRDFERLYKGKDETFIGKIKNFIASHTPAVNTKPRVVSRTMKVGLSPMQLQLIDDVRKKNLKSKSLIDLLTNVLKHGDLNMLNSTQNHRLNAFLTRVRQISNSENPKKDCGNKVSELVRRVMAGPKPAVIYSEYKEYGIDNVEMCLLRAGAQKSEIFKFTGALSVPKRQQLIDDYNSGKIKYLLLTSAGSEGISLKGTRQVHVLEPYWNWARLNQVIGRGVRIDSHTHLPVADQQVDVYYWLSINEDNPEDVLSAPDVYLFAMAQNKKKNIEHYKKLADQASIPMDVLQYVEPEFIDLTAEESVAEPAVVEEVKEVDEEVEEDDDDKTEIDEPVSEPVIISSDEEELEIPSSDEEEDDEPIMAPSRKSKRRIIDDDDEDVPPIELPSSEDEDDDKTEIDEVPLPEPSFEQICADYNNQVASLKTRNHVEKFLDRIAEYPDVAQCITEENKEKLRELLSKFGLESAELGIYSEEEDEDAETLEDESNESNESDESDESEESEELEIDSTPPTAAECAEINALLPKLKGRENVEAFFARLDKKPSLVSCLSRRNRDVLEQLADVYQIGEEDSEGEDEDVGIDDIEYSEEDKKFIEEDEDEDESSAKQIIVSPRKIKELDQLIAALPNRPNIDNLNETKKTIERALNFIGKTPGVFDALDNAKVKRLFDLVFDYNNLVNSFNLGQERMIDFDSAALKPLQKKLREYMKIDREKQRQSEKAGFLASLKRLVS